MHPGKILDAMIQNRKKTDVETSCLVEVCTLQVLFYYHTVLSRQVLNLGHEYPGVDSSIFCEYFTKYFVFAESGIRTVRPCPNSYILF